MPSRAWRAAFAGLVATVACNEGLRPTKGCPGICGTLTYQGQLPDSLKDSTDTVFVLTYHTFPQAPSDLFSFSIPPAEVPAGGPPRRYALSVLPGTYEWVLAVWKKKSAEPLSAQNADSLLREVGFYHDDGDTTSHGSGIVVVTGVPADSINFVIDFGNMHRICTYFPPCPP